MRASILCPVMSSAGLYSIMRSANLFSIAVFFVSCMSSVASKNAVCSFVRMRVKSLHKNEYSPAGDVETDKTLSRKSPMISGMWPFLVLESFSRFRLMSVRWFGWTMVRRWPYVGLQLSVNVAHRILAAGRGSSERGTVGPRASKGFGRLRSIETFKASFSMFVAPTSPLARAMIIL